MSKTKHAQDVVNSLRSLADSIEAYFSSKEAVPDKQEVVKPKEELATAEVKQPTLEEVRAAMAEKNREGHREAVKGILHKYGASKLTALDPIHFAQALKDVGEIK